MSLRTMTGFVLVIGVMLVVGCSRGPSRVHPAAVSASAAGSEAIAMYDTNKDGNISGDELDECPAIKAAMAQIDSSGDKTITAAKIAARITTWQESRVGRVSVMCTVLRNGSPLVGAGVRFVPEKFLGNKIETAEGKTDQSGVAMISVPISDRNDLPGVSPGFYRVEITKTGENIPAKYNINTTLGQEVALDAKGMTEGIRFDLKY